MGQFQLLMKRKSKAGWVKVKPLMKWRMEKEWKMEEGERS
jgi:hypothetical protein